MKLIFVYNAEAGALNGLLDSLHKTLSPSTYECALCQITHGFFGMDSVWRDYLKTLPMESQFFHRQEFYAAYPQVKVELPVILLEQPVGVQTLISAQQLKGFADVNALIHALSEALMTIGAM